MQIAGTLQNCAHAFASFDQKYLSYSQSVSQSVKF